MRLPVPESVRLSYLGREIVMIDVTRIGSGDPLEFDVVIDDGAGRTQHRITMSQETYGRISEGGQRPENCIEAAFHFLLDREPKEAILEQFDITVISRYFPEFEKERPEYMRRAKK